MPRRRIRRPLLALGVLVAALGIGYGVRAADSTHHSRPPAVSTRSAAALSSLPPQAADTVRLIERGGPFPYPRSDGVVFDNNEHLLPAEAHGYYHEYTVVTPGSATRGARRIITGRDGEFYYTADHYSSFVRVDVTR
ncbi:MAG TPA: ribonuclease domain-containing protein [Jatrophihabitantaceae bacterium]|nr:ribonuclease domain-containing protein [Jatrophihabitantaceae bacterium]